jgi:hypothetical protein
MARMLTLQANDAAADALRLPDRLAIQPGSDLTPGLKQIAAQGILRRGNVLMWSGFSGNPDTAPGIFQDLTGWECTHSSFHLEDHVPVNVAIIDGAPIISERDQNVLLLQGLTLALRFRALVYELEEPVPVRCIIGANSTNATFRFHQIRPGERWNAPDLDRYETEKVIVLDIEPAAARLAGS